MAGKKLGKVTDSSNPVRIDLFDVIKPVHHSDSSMHKSISKQGVRDFLFTPSFIPWFLLLLCIAAYAPFITRLGFYWDDLPYVWFYPTLGPLGYFSVFSGDRPFLAVIYSLTAPLVGTYPIAWQIFGILCRWGATLIFWWSFKQVWPKNIRQVTWAAAAFAVFPGFGQQWISSIFSRAFILQAAYVLSLGLMIAAIRHPRKYIWLTILAFVSYAFSMASSEYFFGLEILRPLLIWFVIRENSGTNIQRLTRFIKLWAPFLIAGLGYGIWRAFFFKSSLYSVQAVSSLEASPFNTLWSFIQSIVKNFYTGGFAAWTEGLKTMNILEITQTVIMVYWILIIGVGIVLFVYFSRLKTNQTDQENNVIGIWNRWDVQAMLAGGLGLLTATVPFWAAGLPYTLNFPWDRFGLTFMVVSSLFLIGIIDFFLRTNWQKAILISLFLTLAVGEQYQIANTYRTEWVNLQKFLQQMTWRVPGLKPNTMVIAYELPFEYYSDNSLTAAVNWVYAPENRSYNLPYVLDYMSVRKNSYLSNLNPGVTVNQGYRTMKFTGNTSDSIVIYQPVPGCLHLMDLTYSNKKTIPQASLHLALAIPLSNLNQVITAPKTPASLPPELNQGEPKPDWCYYFEKADLARQMEDWTKAARLGDEAIQSNLSAKDPSEWLPFIEAYAHIGKIDQALRISREQAKANNSIVNGLCQTWSRIEGYSSAGSTSEEAAAQIQVELKCQER